jgi:hypothetical protein
MLNELLTVYYYKINHFDTVTNYIIKELTASEQKYIKRTLKLLPNTVELICKSNFTILKSNFNYCDLEELDWPVRCEEILKWTPIKCQEKL